MGKGWSPTKKERKLDRLEQKVTQKKDALDEIEEKCREAEEEYICAYDAYTQAGGSEM